MIVVSHSLPRYGSQNNIGYLDFYIATFDVNALCGYLGFFFGQIGNAFFVVCSSWFLVDRKKPANIKKVLHLLTDNFYISILWLLITVLVFRYISLGDICKSFFPVTFNNNWFVGCYAIFYLLHIPVNTWLKDLKQNELLNLVVILSIVYLALITLLGPKYYYTDLIGFYVIYLIVKYIKEYSVNLIKGNIAIKVHLISWLILLMGIAVWSWICTIIPVLNNQVLRFCVFYNPVIVILALSAVISFSRIRSNKLMAMSKFANVSLFVYIIDENFLANKYFKPVLWDYIYLHYGYQLLPIYILIFSAVSWIIASMLGLFFKKCISPKLYIIIDKVAIISVRKYARMIENLKNKI